MLGFRKELETRIFTRRWKLKLKCMGGDDQEATL